MRNVCLSVCICHVYALAPSPRTGTYKLCAGSRTPTTPLHISSHPTPPARARAHARTLTHSHTAVTTGRHPSGGSTTERCAQNTSPSAPTTRTDAAEAPASPQSDHRARISRPRPERTIIISESISAVQTTRCFHQKSMYGTHSDVKQLNLAWYKNPRKNALGGTEPMRGFPSLGESLRIYCLYPRERYTPLQVAVWPVSASGPLVASFFSTPSSPYQHQGHG